MLRIIVWLIIIRIIYLFFKSMREKEKNKKVLKSKNVNNFENNFEIENFENFILFKNLFKNKTIEEFRLDLRKDLRREVESNDSLNLYKNIYFIKNGKEIKYNINYEKYGEILNKTLILRKEGKYTEALELANRILTEDGESYAIYFNLFSTEFCALNFKNALNYLEKMKEIDNFIFGQENDITKNISFMIEKIEELPFKILNQLFKDFSKNSNYQLPKDFNLALKELTSLKNKNIEKNKDIEPQIYSFEDFSITEKISCLEDIFENIEVASLDQRKDLRVEYQMIGTEKVLKNVYLTKNGKKIKYNGDDKYSGGFDQIVILKREEKYFEALELANILLEQDGESYSIYECLFKIEFCALKLKNALNYLEKMKEIEKLIFEEESNITKKYDFIINNLKTFDPISLEKIFKAISGNTNYKFPKPFNVAIKEINQ